MPVNSHLKAASIAAGIMFYEKFRSLYSRQSYTKKSIDLPNIINDSFSTKANRLAKLTCGSIAQLSQLALEKETMQRLSLHFAHWLETDKNRQTEQAAFIQGVNGFRFNTAASINQKLEVNIETDWTSIDRVQVKIPTITPKQDIIAPARTIRIELKILPICISAISEKRTGFTETISSAANKRNIISISFPHTNERIAANEFELNIPVQPQTICMLIASLEFIVMQKGGMKSTADKKWMPVDILTAVYCKG